MVDHENSLVERGISTRNSASFMFGTETSGLDLKFQMSEFEISLSLLKFHELIEVSLVDPEISDK